MQTRQFPQLALVFGVALGAVLVFGSAPGADGSTTLPLLTLLVVSEFGFIVTAIGAGMSFRQIAAGEKHVRIWSTACACAGLALFLLVRGIALWPK